MRPELYPKMVQDYVQMFFLRKYHEEFERQGPNAVDNMAFVAFELLPAFMERSDVRSGVAAHMKSGSRPSQCAAALEELFVSMAFAAIEKVTGARWT